MLQAARNTARQNGGRKAQLALRPTVWCGEPGASR
ncbi:hypothetical protein FHS38_006463 [Streptomyces netropsis]|uniref:Uncharacterized protein n=1 Tax=Streptomyces netropsis TaxID=55404 RepID=A0A7W7LHJ7_STRNE|nr:hypothetical protein [Streptomyces netropsis]